MPHPSLSGLDHVSLVAANVTRTVEFYADVLGLHVHERGPDDTRSTRDQVWLGTDRHPFITIAQSADGRPGELGPGTIHHIAFTVESLDELLKWKRWLTGNDLLVAGPYDQRAYQDIAVTDPDGVAVEMATYGPGFKATQDGKEVYSPPPATLAPFRDEELIDAKTWPDPVTEIEPDMTLQGLHHIATITSSLERTDSFYREVLGLQLIRKTIDSADPEVERWYWGLDAGRPGTLVTAFPVVHPHEGGKAPEGRIGPGVPARFALDAGGPEALPGWSTSLSAAKVAANSILDEAGNRAICVHDPDGVNIELVSAEVEDH